MQTVAGKIEAQRRTLAVEPHIQSDVGPLQLHRRPLPGALAQLIDDRVLGLQRAEVRVLDAGGCSTEFDGERAIRRDVLRPVDRCDAFVQGLRRCGRKIPERHENATRGTGPQTRAIRSFQRALEQHAELELASVSRTAGAQLGCRQVSDPRRT